MIVDGEFAKGSVDGYEIARGKFQLGIEGSDSYRRGAVCGLLSGWAVSLVEASDREVVADALRQLAADFGSRRLAPPRGLRKVPDKVWWWIHGVSVGVTFWALVRGW